jgi:hypothetical protein
MPRKRGTVTVWSLGQVRFRVEAADASREIDGFDAARDLAHQVAAQLDAAVGWATIPKDRAGGI